MSMSIAEPDVQVTPRWLTAADLAVLPEDLPSGPAKYELWKGELSIMAPPGGPHGASQARITTELVTQGERRGHGRVWVETGVILGRNPDTVLSPDGFFIHTSRLPMRLSSEGYSETIPDLVVEVRSKNDSPRALHRKAERYLQAGVRLVWILDPTAKTVEVFREGATIIQLRAQDQITAGDVIPDFSVAVFDLFRD